MAEFHFTRKAVVDLNSIWNYSFEKWSEKQADKYYKVILETCKDLADNPEMGKSSGKSHQIFTDSR